MSDKCYVEKWHYDRLFKQYSELVQDHAWLKDSWNGIKDIVKHLDPSLLDDMKKLNGAEFTLEEQRAYTIGAFSALIYIEMEIKKLEDQRNGSKVSSDQQQDSV